MKLRKPTRFLLAGALAAFGGTELSAQSAEADSVCSRFSIGGNGVMIATRKDYAPSRFETPAGSRKKKHADVAIPSFVLKGEYKITRKWILGAEIEFGAGGTAQGVGKSASADDGTCTYETSVDKHGSVTLEEFHLTRLIRPGFNLRFGNMTVPVSLAPAYDEPANFLGAAAPEGASAIIPDGWHETGVGIFGEFGRKRASFDYEAMITASLNPDGFDACNWVQGGGQGLFETDNFSAPAYTLRINWCGVTGLRVGGSVFFNPNAGHNGDNRSAYNGVGKINVLLYSFDAQYENDYLVARATCLSGHIPHTAGITSAGGTAPDSSPYSGAGPVARRAVDWSAEAGVNLKSLFPNLRRFPDLVPFAHYNYYNPQRDVVRGLEADRRGEVSLWSVGVNYRILPNLIAKFDYTTRRIGTSRMFGKGRYNSENELRLSLSYAFSFEK